MGRLYPYRKEATYDHRNPNHPAGPGEHRATFLEALKIRRFSPATISQPRGLALRVLPLPGRPGHRRRARRGPPDGQGLPALALGPGLHADDRHQPHAGRAPVLRAPGGNRRDPGQSVRRHPATSPGQPPAQGRADPEGGQGPAGRTRHADRRWHPRPGHPRDFLLDRHPAGGNGPADHPRRGPPQRLRARDQGQVRQGPHGPAGPQGVRLRPRVSAKGPRRMEQGQPGRTRPVAVLAATRTARSKARPSKSWSSTTAATPASRNT